MNVTPTGTPTPYSIDDITQYTQPPKKTGAFKAVLGGIARGAANIMFPGLGGILNAGSAISGQLLGSSMPGLGSQATQMLALQNQMNQEQLVFTTISTLIKVRHDSAVEAVRNMKSS